MATEVSYNGDANDKTFDITFPFLRETHIKVQVGGQTQSITTDYSISGTVVTFVTAPPSGTANVRLYRDTPFTPLHDYSAGSSVKADALNENQQQVLYAIEEAKLVTVTAGGITTGSKNDLTVNSNSDWVVNANAIETSMIASDQVTYDRIQDIGTANRVLGKASTGTVEEVQVATDMIANDAVTLAKMAGGTDGNLITYDASGNPAYVATGTTGQALTSNGAGAAPTFQTVVNVPVGTVIWYGGSTAPTGYLKANGDTIPNTSGTVQGVTANFAPLYAIIGATLPDLRGEFIRGFDDGKGTDSGRTIRSTQAEAYKSHAHDSNLASASNSDSAIDVDDPGHAHDMTCRGTADSESTAIASGKSDHNVSSTETTHSETTGIDIDIALTIDSEGGTETRPRNVALLACIKY
tara:strand:- start:28 stop:1257 length:1230 start_codon:yes stop_codon:yes gene_type:complete